MVPTRSFNTLFLRSYFFLDDSLAAAAAAGALVESRILIPIVRAPFLSFSFPLFLSRLPHLAHTRCNSVAWVEYRFHILSQKLLIFKEHEARVCRFKILQKIGNG